MVAVGMLVEEVLKVTVDWTRSVMDSGTVVMTTLNSLSGVMVFSSAWNAGLALDPFDPATIYYGSQFLHKSTDRGDSWEPVLKDTPSVLTAWVAAA